MSKRLSLSFMIATLFLLIGCQATATDDSSINEEAKEVYNIIENRWNNNESPSETQNETINNFYDKYVVNYKDYPADEEVLSEMDILINSHKLYYVAVGVNDKESQERYMSQIDTAIEKMDSLLTK